MSSSPRAPAHARTADVDTRPSLTVLSGFWPVATFAVVRTLLAADPSLLLVRHDLAGIRDGVVRRMVRSGAGIVENQQVDLVHGCISCTLREDVLPTLVRLARGNPGHDLVRVDSDLVDAGTLSHQLRHTHRHRPETPGVLARGLQRYPLGTHEPESDCGMVSVVFRARRRSTRSACTTYWRTSTPR